MLFSTAIASEARAWGGNGSVVSPSSDRGAPTVDDTVGDDEFEVGADSAVSAVVNAHRPLKLSAERGSQVRKQFRVNECVVVPSAFALAAATRTVRTYKADPQNGASEITP